MNNVTTNETTAAAQKRQVPALSRGLRILEELKTGPKTAPELTRALGLPRTTVHELVKTLESLNFITVLNGAYTLGIRLFELGLAAGDALDVRAIGVRIAEEVAAAVDETVQVAVLDERDVVYVAKAESTRAVKLVSHVGSRLPAHLTGVGKALLAFRSPAELDALMPPGTALPVLTEHSVNTTDALREQLAEIVRTGLATEICESNDDVRCVAAPVRDHTGQVIAAMSIAIPVYRWTPAKDEQLRAAVVAGARSMSAALGHRG